MRYQYKQIQQQQQQANSRAVIKADNKLFRVQNPMRNELSTSVLFLFKFHLKNSIKKTIAKHPQINTYDLTGVLTDEQAKISKWRDGFEDKRDEWQDKNNVAADFAD